MIMASVLTAKGQDGIADIQAHLFTDRISLEYSCTLAGEVPVKLSGTLLLQGDSYSVRGNGIEIYCNGGTRWTVDREAKEVYIEPADGLAEVTVYYESISELKIGKVEYSPLSDDLGAFIFDTSALGPDWVITDLR